MLNGRSLHQRRNFKLSAFCIKKSVKILVIVRWRSLILALIDNSLRQMAAVTPKFYSEHTKRSQICLNWSYLSGIVSCPFVALDRYCFLHSLRSGKVMHISIADDIKKRFHAACAIHRLKMSQVVAQLIDQWLWLKANKALLSAGLKSQSNHQYHSFI